MFKERVNKIKHNLKLSNLHIYKLHLLRNYYMSGAYKFSKFPVKEILICGLNRSGSTMLYNIIKLMMELSEKKGDVYIKNDYDYVGLLEQYKHEPIALFKIHHFSILAKKRIEAGRAIAFFTHRDTRDVCVSLIQKGWLTMATYFSKRVYKYHYYNSILYTSVKGMHTFTYKQLMEDKRQVIHDLAIILGKSLTEAEVDAIVFKTDIQNTRKTIKANVQQSAEYNVSSQLHHNHIADGKSDKYLSFFNEKELKKLNRKNKKFLRHFKYIQNEE